MGQVGLMGFALALFFLAWMRFATLLFALFFGTNIPTSIRNAVAKKIAAIDEAIALANRLVVGFDLLQK